MLTIDRLRLTLPPAFGPRADALARLVADELADLPLSGERQLERLTVPPVEVPQGSSERDMARNIARAIHRELVPRGG